MNIASPAFAQWIDETAPGVPLVDICAKAGLSLSTISEQRSGNRITPKTVIAISRAYGLRPPHELAKFPGYESLDGSQLTLVEAVPLYSSLDLLHQWYVRKGKALPGAVFSAPDGRLKRWVDLNRQRSTQKELAQSLGMQPSNFSRQITDETLPIYRIVELAYHLGVSALPGLAAAGVLRFDEVFGCSALEYLSVASDVDLVESIRLSSLFLPLDIDRFVSL